MIQPLCALWTWLFPVKHRHSHRPSSTAMRYCPRLEPLEVRNLLAINITAVKDVMNLGSTTIYEPHGGRWAK